MYRRMFVVLAVVLSLLTVGFASFVEAQGGGAPFARLNASNVFTGAKNRFQGLVEVFHRDPNGFGFFVETDQPSTDPFAVNGITGAYNNPAGAGKGVFGFAIGQDGVGVHGLADASLGGIGVQGNAQRANGVGVRGLAEASSGFSVGVDGVTASKDGVGGTFSNPAGGTILQGNGLNFALAFVIDADGQFHQVSSAALKTDVKPLNGAMDKVEQLHGVSFRWKASGDSDIGFIAEEVAEVLPEVVHFETGSNRPQAVDYSRVAALLVEAVKEQAARISELEARIEELRQQR